MSEDAPNYSGTVVCCRCGHIIGQPCAERIVPLPELNWAVRLDGDIIAVFENARMAAEWTWIDENEGATVEKIIIAKGTP